MTARKAKKASAVKGVAKKATPHWSELLKPFSPCDPGLKWAKKQPTLREAWNKCPYSDWITWLADKLDIPYVDAPVIGGHDYSKDADDCLACRKQVQFARLATTRPTMALLRAKSRLLATGRA